MFFLAVVVSTWCIRESTKLGENQELDNLLNVLAFDEKIDLSSKPVKRGCFTWSRYKSVRCHKKKRDFMTKDAKVCFYLFGQKNKNKLFKNTFKFNSTSFFILTERARNFNFGVSAKFYGSP